MVAEQPNRTGRSDRTTPEDLHPGEGVALQPPSLGGVFLRERNPRDTDSEKGLPHEVFPERRGRGGSERARGGRTEGPTLGLSNGHIRPLGKNTW